MMAKVIPLHRATLGPSIELTSRLQEVGIDPHHFYAADTTDDHLTSNTIDAIAGLTTDPTSLERLDEVKQEQRFKFSIESEAEGSESLRYKPELSLSSSGRSNPEDVLGIHVNPEAIGRIVVPVVSIARAFDFVNEHDPADTNYAKVVKVAMSSTLALAVSYAIFCEFGRFDTKHPFEPCPELEAIAEESGIAKREEEFSGVWLREVGLRFAGGVTMRYLATLAASEFNNDDNPNTELTTDIDNIAKFGLAIRSMALLDKLAHEYESDQPVSYALQHAYRPEQIRRVSNLWFRVPKHV